ALYEKLGERFRVLGGGSRTAEPRQQTLRATIDWSYNLLSESERLLFDRLSIFCGRFDFDHLEAVCTDDRVDVLDALDLLTSLVDKSLVKTEYREGEASYRLLESIRAYSQEKLSESGDFDAIAERHFAHLCDRFGKAGKEYETKLSAKALAAMVDDLDDARAALEWAASRGNLVGAAEFFLSTTLWDYLGLYREALDRAQTFESNLSGNDVLRSRVLEHMSLIYTRRGDFGKAASCAQTAVDLARSANDSAALSAALIRFGVAVANARRFEEADAAFNEADKQFAGSPRQRVQIADARGRLAVIAGDLDRAATFVQQNLNVYRSAGNDYGEVAAAINLAEIDYERGESEKAIDVARNAVEKAEKLFDNGVLAAALLRNVAGYCVACDRLDEAEDAVRRSIAIDRVAGVDGSGIAIALEHLALVRALRSDVKSAAILEGFAESALQRLGFHREHTEEATHKRLMSILESTLEAAALADAKETGAQLSAEAAVALASV
ncbi:MAG: hypothetical protein JO199_11770, partial [Candidatus Eremiobacteraeota bacterium]|nr:hypothetical protein [Candidatus Eremiobacteraeota bacterium]